MDKLISICTPTWNHAEDLLRPFIINMLQTTGPETEIIIVNNGSTDTSLDILRYYNGIYPDKIRYFHFEENQGFAAAENKAYELARGKYILFLNDDVESKKKDWPMTFAKLAEQRNDKTVLGAQMVENNTWTAVLDDKPITYLNGWCMFFPRKILEEIGPFDTGVGKGFFEDVELSYRVEKAGYKLEQINETGLVHFGSKTIGAIPNLADELTKKARRYYRTRMILHRLEKNKNKRIVLLIPSNYPFNDWDWEGKGVGGAESSVINLARALAAKGQDVWVYNNCNRQGVFSGVHWAHIKTFEPADYCDVAIVFRMPFKHMAYVNAPVKIFWSCDQYTIGNWHKEIFPFVDRTVAISPYHKRYLRKYVKVPEKFVEVIDLGIDKKSYEAEPVKVPGKMIFCSVPERGLGFMKEIFTKIKEQVPEATLTITSDYTLWGAEANNAQYKHIGEIPGVKYLGKVPREELVREQMSSSLMVYPCNYDELFCIAAAECIAAGAVPVTTPIGALPTTVGETGILIYKSLATDGATAIVNAAVDLLKNEKLRKQIQDAGRKRMFEKYDWSVIASQWLDLFDNIKKYKENGGEKLWKQI